MFELGIQKNWIDALYARSSVRQYTGAPDKEQLDRLGETCRKLSWQGVKIRMFKGPGLKSQIKGTDVYAVIIAKRGTPMEVEGFMGEALVLEATAMGLGTCWLGAGFYLDIINRNVDLQTDEAVHCVISIGKANLPAFAPKRKELPFLTVFTLRCSVPFTFRLRTVLILVTTTEYLFDMMRNRKPSQMPPPKSRNCAFQTAAR